MPTLILIALAGALGAISRHGLNLLMLKLTGGNFPWGIFVVNILGCFCFGIIVQLSSYWSFLTSEMRTIVLVGFMGSFTTFSTFIFDTQIFMQEKSWFELGLNLIGQIGLGLLALNLGMKLVSNHG